MNLFYNNDSEYILVCLAELLQGKNQFLFGRDSKEIRFQAKPDPNDLSRLFRLISENFMSLHCSILGGQKHKDEAFIVRTLIYSLSHMCVTYILYV